ncbi:MAG: hypothetical protein D6689_17830, partial [Deltaproteobacteria bacterium]
YNGEITYHDEHMGAFLDGLAQRGLDGDTLVVITNDHGEELGEHGRWGHGHSLYDELLRDPVAMRYPPLFPAGKRVADPVEDVDLAPTILEVAGVDPIPGVDGESLVPLVRGGRVARPLYAVAEFLDHARAVRVGRWKLIRGAGGASELYDVEADPTEKTNRADDAPIALRLCEVMLGEAIATPTKRKRLEERSRVRKFESGNANIDPELRKQLEALGYLGGGG